MTPPTITDAPARRADDEVRIPHPTEIRPVDAGGDLRVRRRRALQEATSELIGPTSRARPAVATRVYADGCLALALGGTFTRPAVDRLRAMLGGMHRLARVELVVDLSQLHSCEPALVRPLTRLRMQRLVAGARVEVHHPPPELATALGETPVETFRIVDDVD